MPCQLGINCVRKVGKLEEQETPLKVGRRKQPLGSADDLALKAARLGIGFWPVCRPIKYNERTASDIQHMTPSSAPHPTRIRFSPGHRRPFDSCQSRPNLSINLSNKKPAICRTSASVATLRTVIYTYVCMYRYIQTHLGFICFSHFPCANFHFLFRFNWPPAKQIVKAKGIKIYQMSLQHFEAA